MHKKTRLIFGFLLTAVFMTAYNAVAQINIWPYLKETYLDLSDDGIEIIKQADQQRRYAENLISVSGEAGRREGINDGFDELFRASGIIFELLENHMDAAKGEVPDPLPAEMRRASEFETRSADYFEKAMQLKEEAEATGDDKKAISVLFMAWDIEMVSILYKARALQVYQDFPMVYQYPWSYDFAVLSDTPREAKGIIETPAGGEEETELQGPDGRPENRAEGDEQVVPDTGIHYIIQLAAHTEELDRRQLNAIYSGDERISMMFEDGWHKYFIGPYNTYEEADSMMKASGLRNVFIAAYHEGQRISIGEARRREAGGN